MVLTAVAGFADIPKSPSWAGSYFEQLSLNLGLDLQGGSQLMYQADVSEIPESDRAESINGVRDVIERRVNAFGVSEPVVQTSTVNEEYRVIIELPGVQDIDEAIEKIGETPLLEFRVPPPPENPDIDPEEFNAQSLAEAESTLLELKDGADFATLAAEKSDDSTAAQGGDLGFAARGVYVPEFEEIVFDTAEVGVLYPEIVETQFGYHIIRVEEKRTSELEEGEEAQEEVRARHILFEKFEDPSQDPFAIFSYENSNLTGAHLDRASVEFDQIGTPTVTLNFNSEGAELFEQITTDHVGEQVAIFLDGAPISAPVVNQPISGGQAVISGSFTVDEARDLARNLNAGALPVPIELVSQQTVGPTLGQVSIERSFLAAIIGIVAVILFMLAYYRLPGFFAVVSLAIYLSLCLALFKVLGITLTLAGIAGFILSIGLAVDANVLIFERMREHLREGKSVYSAIEDGFRDAWISIRDSNVSSLITCLILAWFGTSLIQGFAITLALGIVVSMFTAITITRTFLRLFLRRVTNAKLL